MISGHCFSQSIKSSLLFIPPCSSAFLLWQASSWINLTFTDQSNCLITTFCLPCHHGPLLTRVTNEHLQSHLQKIFYLTVVDLLLSPEVICNSPVCLSLPFYMCSELFYVGSCSSQMEALQQSYLSSGLRNYTECQHKEDCFISKTTRMTGQVDHSNKSIQEGRLRKMGKNLSMVLFMFITQAFTSKPLSFLYSKLF